jgi:hypothetical protein
MKRPLGIHHMWGSVYVCRECAIKKGGLLGRKQVALHDIGGLENMTPRNLQSLADAGIMDSNPLFLPAGKLTKAETEARERAQML